MAANAPSLHLLLLVCVLCYAVTFAKADATLECATKLQECLQSMLPAVQGIDDPADPAICSVMATYQTCVLNVLNKCPPEMKTKVLESVKKQAGGSELSMDTEKHCCTPMNMCDTVAFAAATQVFKHTDKQCKATEDFWTCTRPAMKTISSKCKFMPIVDGAKKANYQLKDKLEKCKNSGYNVTVHFVPNGGEGLFQCHPLMTLVATVSAILLGVNRFQI